jgi:membrane fusion protein (multidrug efflux system)
VAAAKASADLDATDLERARNLYAEKTTTKADLDHAEAAARVSRAKLEQAEKAAVVARARQEQATTRVKVAESTLAQAKVGVDRSQAALEAARARLKSARSEARQVDVAKSERDRQRAEVARAEADLERAQLDLGYTKLVAPVAGRITKKSLTVGQWVQAGQAVLALVPDEVWVVGNYKETQVGHIRPGLPVRIEVDAFPDHVFTGRVDSVQAGTGSRFSLLPAENATGNYVKVVQRIPVKIVFDPLPDLSRFPLSPGMSVVPDVKIEAE